MWTAILPVAINDRVVAVVYADAGTRTGESAPSVDRQAGLDVTERLIRHAGQRLAALQATAGVDVGVNSEAPPASDARDPSTEQTDRNEQQCSDRTQQYARLLVSEITRYPMASAPTLLEPLSERLTNAIEQWSASRASDHPAKLSRLLSV